MIVGGGAHHSAVTPRPRPTQHASIDDPERITGSKPFGVAVPAQLVRPIRRELRQRIDVDLTLLAKCAGHQCDVCVGSGRVVGERCAGTDGLVVGMRVHKHRAVAGVYIGHRPTVTRRLTGNDDTGIEQGGLDADVRQHCPLQAFVRG